MLQAVAPRARRGGRLDGAQRALSRRGWRRRSACRWSSCRSCSPRSSASPSCARWPSASPRSRRARATRRGEREAIAEVVARHRVVVCAGSGGVGKTTTAAALAVYGAHAGAAHGGDDDRSGAPARRRARAAHARQRGARGRAAGGRAPSSAMMLDQKGAWDALVERYAPSAEVRERILANRFYQHLSESFAGSQEYMAIEQLAELHASGRYDLIVVDTPPTRHALDFLDAPQAHRRLPRPPRRALVRQAVLLRRLVDAARGEPHRRHPAAPPRGGHRRLGAGRDLGLLHLDERAVRGLRAARAGASTSCCARAAPPSCWWPRRRSRCSARRRTSAASCRAVDPAARGGLQPRAPAKPWPTAAPRRGVAARRSCARAVKRAERAERLVDNFLRYETQARGDHAAHGGLPPPAARPPAVAIVPNFEEDLHDLDGLRRMLPHLMAA